MSQASRGALGAVQGAGCVVFVCSGNMVRSAFAELYARHVSFPLPVRSLATTYRNDGLYPETALELARRGIDADWIRSFRPTHLDDAADGLPADAVFLGMTRGHLSALAAHGDFGARSHLLGEVAGRPIEIADPVLEGADFGQTFARVARCVDVLADHLRG